MRRVVVHICDSDSKVGHQTLIWCKCKKTSENTRRGNLPLCLMTSNNNVSEIQQPRIVVIHLAPNRL